MAFPPHYPDVIKELEHLGMELLFKKEEATLIGQGTGGPASAGSSWDKGRGPQAGDRLWIPTGCKIDWDMVLPDPLLSCTAEGGWLNFLPDRNTAINVVDFCCCPDEAAGVQGKLTIGDQGAPIQPAFTATWTIGDRGIRDDAARLRDPLDFGAVLESHSTLRMFGAPKTSYAPPSSFVKANATTVSFATVPADWAVGDVLLFAPMWYNNAKAAITQFGVAQGQTDEVRTIVAVAGTTVTLDTALLYDHGLRLVGNLSRNVVIHSAVTDDITRRGHVMQMHRQDAKVDSVEFRDLGRTNPLVTHTVPTLTSFDPVTGAMGTLVPGTDSNTIGRYGGFHAHIRSGPTWSSSPITVSNCSVRNGCKIGLNQHGAYAYYFQNVVYNVCTALFCENGGEFGAWRRNLSVCCIPVEISPDIRPGGNGVPEDNAFQGAGFWFTSGVEVTDNTAYCCGIGHASWARELLFDMTPDGTSSYLNSANLNPPAGLIGPDGNAFERPAQTGAVPIAGGDPTKINPRSVGAYVARGKSIGCYQGLFSYQEFPTSAGQAYFQVDIDGCWMGWANSYTSNSTLHDCTVSNMVPGKAIDPNPLTTSNITSKNCKILNVDIGERVPIVGDSTFTNTEFNCNQPLIIDGPWPGTLTLTGCTLDPYPNGKLIQIQQNLGPIDVANDTKYKYRFSPFRFIIDGKDIIHDCRMPDYVPFPVLPAAPLLDFNAAWVGLTNAQLFAQFGLWIGGYQIPAQTRTPHPWIPSGASVGMLGPIVGPTPPPPPPPAAPVAAFSASPMTGTAPLTVQFTDQSTGSPTLWLWNFGDGSTGMMQNPSHQYAAAGTYTVSLTATNAGGSNTTTKTSLITVAVPQVAVPDVATAFNAAISAASSQAQASLQAAGLTATVVVPSVTQSPAAGTMVPVGSPVSVS